jgi:hypothetical protein
MLPPTVEEQRLGAALAFLVARARADASPIALLLWTDIRIAVNLSSGCLEDLTAQALGQAKHVDRAMHTGLCGLHVIKLVVTGARRASEVINLVKLHVEGKIYVVAVISRAGSERRCATFTGNR